MRSTGLVLAAGGIVIANEVVFAPVAGDTQTDFNWRLIPATLILAMMFGGLETVAPGFAVGLGGLTLLAVLVIQNGNAKSPLDNITAIVTGAAASPAAPVTPNSKQTQKG